MDNASHKRLFSSGAGPADVKGEAVPCKAEKLRQAVDGMAFNFVSDAPMDDKSRNAHVEAGNAVDTRGPSARAGTIDSLRNSLLVRDEEARLLVSSPEPWTFLCTEYPSHELTAADRLLGFVLGAASYHWPSRFEIASVKIPAGIHRITIPAGKPHRLVLPPGSIVIPAGDEPILQAAAEKFGSFEVIGGSPVSLQEVRSLQASKPLKKGVLDHRWAIGQL